MINKLLIAVLLTALSATATAEFVGPGSTKTLITVSQIDNKRNGSRVTLVGLIINQVDDEFYTFQDDTGSMVVQIDHDELRGMKVTPETEVRIKGEVDDDDYDSKVDVDYVELVK